MVRNISAGIPLCPTITDCTGWNFSWNTCRPRVSDSLLLFTSLAYIVFGIQKYYCYLNANHNKQQLNILVISHKLYSMQCVKLLNALSKITQSTE